MHTLIVVVATYVVLTNCIFGALQLWLLRQWQPQSRFLASIIYLWTFVMSGLFLLEVFEPGAWKSFMREWLYFPMAVEMSWNVLLLQALLPILIVVVLVMLRRRRKKPAPEPVDGMTRRKFIYLLSYGAAPTIAVGMGVHGALTRTDLQVRHFDIPIAGLPPELEGFTIAHVSDLHSGLFVGPERLKIIGSTANNLKADLVAVTGDIINREMDEFPAALSAIQSIQSKYGTYLCEGNHDVIPGPGKIAEACALNNLPMLSNACATVQVGGRRLLLGGLPWMGRDFEGKPELVSSLFPARQEGDVRILLAHHPDILDSADSADLVLSGHTHGGQIMFGPIGLGRIRFKYWSGFYQRGNTQMIVSNGCGDWFPCRIGAPAEIGLIRLTAAKT